MNLVLLGAPGAGKGTQAQFLVRDFGFLHISTGDLLRGAVAAGTPLGIQVKEIMASGKLVSDELVIALVKDRISQDDAHNGFILDGFPRTVEQAKALDNLLDELHLSLDGALYVNVSEATIVDRLSSRKTCKACGYTAGKDCCVCPACEGEMYQRPDDTPEAISTRLSTYHNQTSPLIDFYKAQSKLKEVDGGALPDEVYGEVKRILGL